MYHENIFKMPKHIILISRCLEVAVVALFRVTKPREKLEVDLTQVKKLKMLC